MTRILVSIPDDLHDVLRELAVRNRTSMSKLILAAVEDTYEDEIDAIVGERALARHLAEPSSYASWDEVKTRLRAQAEARLKQMSSAARRTDAVKKTPTKPRVRTRIGVQN